MKGTLSGYWRERRLCRCGTWIRGR